MNILIVDDNPTNLQMFKRLAGRFESCTPLTFDALSEALA